MRRKLVPFLYFVLTTDGFSQALGPNSFVGGGLQNTVTATSDQGFIGAGARNTNAANNCGIVAGVDNNIKTEARRAFIGAGNVNLIEAGSTNSFIGAGYRNLIDFNSIHSFIGAGYGNVITTSSNNFCSVIGGGERNVISMTLGTISGGLINRVSGLCGTVAGGYANLSAGDSSTVGGGTSNDATGNYSVIAGGAGNDATNWYTTVGGGCNNSAYGYSATVAGGFVNINSGLYGALAGGCSNRVTGDWATVSGGMSNVAVARNATIPGGSRNTVGNNGSFVWGDGSSPTASWADNTFTVRAIGGTRFYTAAGTATGVRLAAGGTAWASLSDRASKQDFQPVDKREILKKVADLPVTSWTYKTDLSRRYIGPMAQDFHSTFGLGDDDKSITTLDTDGVMYAAIQGLVEELKERDQMMALQRLENASALVQRDGEIESLKKDIRELKNRIDSMLPPSSVKK